MKQKILSRSDNSGTRTHVSSTHRDTPTQKQSRYVTPSKPAPTTTTTPSVTNDDETETSSEEETESEEELDEEESKTDMAKTDIGPLLARSANARDNSSDNGRKESRDEPYTRSRYTPKEETKYAKKEEDETPKYGYTSRFLNKSRSSANIPPDDDDIHTHTSSRYAAPAEDESKYSSGRSRYMALKDRRQRLARSKSSQQFGDEDEPDEPVSPTTANPSAYLASRGYGSTTPGQDLARSRSSHALKSSDPSPERSASTSEKDGAALSSWARYLKNKYGNRGTTKEKDVGSTSTPPGNSSSAAARRLSLGLPLRSSSELASSDDDSKNMQGSPTTPTAATQAAGKIQNLKHFPI